MKPGISVWVQIATAVLLSGPATSVVAQAEAEGASPLADEALVALEYLIGEWRVRSFERDASGVFVEAPQPSFYRARYLYDGLSILAEFYGESRRGFYGVHLVSFDPERGLVHSYLNARANRRLEFLGRHDDGRYHLTRRGGYGGGDHLFRETDAEIRPDSFEKRTYTSDDDGRTWQEGTYCFLFERVGSAHPDPTPNTSSGRAGCLDDAGRADRPEGNVRR